MKYILLASVLTFYAFNVSAQRSSNQIEYCDSQEIRVEMENRFPGYSVGAAYERQPMNPKALRVVYSSIINSRYLSQGGIVCIGVAVDMDGIAQDAHVHPSEIALSRAERRNLLKIKFSPNEINESPSPTIIVFSMAKIRDEF